MFSETQKYIYITLRESIEFIFRKKANKSILFSNNRGIASFIESCYKVTAIQKEANREAVEKTTALNKLNNKYLNISLFSSFPFDLVFNYKIFAKTDIVIN